MQIKINDRTDEHAVEVVLQRGNTLQTVTYSSSDVRLAPRAETAVAGLLLVAMAAGEDMHVDAPLGPTFSQNLSTIQDIYATWGKGLSRIDVQVRGAEQPSAEKAGEKTATFFSGGVDSFYTFLKHSDEIDALIFVHGFDVGLNDRPLRSSVSARLRAVAKAYGKELVEVETTLRNVTEKKRFTPEFANWELSHGSALASVAHVLSGQFDRIYIPATHTYDLIFPFGSHPLFDPLWSSRQLSLMQDGCEADRVAKCELIAEHPHALNALRVCWKNPEGAYNCGRCEKCMRTMLILKAIRALEQCRTFRDELTLRDVARIRIKKERWERYYKAILDRFGEAGNDRKMRRAIKTALYGSRMRRMVRKVLR